MIFTFRPALCLILLFFAVALGLPNQLTGQNFTPDIVVALDGTGDFTTIQAAIDAVPDNSNTPTIIYIKRGLYNTEKLIIRSNKQKVVMIGESRDETIISYHMHNCPNGYLGYCPPEDAQVLPTDLRTSASTLTVQGDDFWAENLTFQNTAGPVGQAQALGLRGDRVVLRNCTIKGYQDTIYFWGNGRRNYVENCLITGRTDYLYGGGTAFLQGCEIRSWGGGYITAPATLLGFDYGLVFNECDLTYDWNSPRSSDNGRLTALGRPWNDYPKVAFLYCYMTEKINPLGWPTTWDMPYAATSEDVEFFEYQNTGPGADMSGRNDWLGLRALTDEEAQNYTLEAVLAGNDNWNPTDTEPYVDTYTWTGTDSSPNWLVPGNWDLLETPAPNQIAFVRSADTIVANGGLFVADLWLQNGATLSVAESSELTYLSTEDAFIHSAVNTSLSGHIQTKDTLTIATMADTLQLDAQLFSEAHNAIHKTGAGTLTIHSENPEFAGRWEIQEGSLAAKSALALGRAQEVTINDQATLSIDTSAAFNFKSLLRIQEGGQIVLHDNILLYQCYFGDEQLPNGIYSAASHPDIISGEGVIEVVEWDGDFTFIGGENGHWDVPGNFQPPVIPEAGETVSTEIEMETTDFVFPGDIDVLSGGGIRLRGDHRATGDINMAAGTYVSYETSGQGYSLDALVIPQADISFLLNSSSSADHAMILNSPLEGDATISVLNTGTDTENRGTLVLTRDNQDFDGTWDLTQAGVLPNSVIAIEGEEERAFGAGLLEIGANNRAVLSHELCLGSELNANLYENGRIEINTFVRVDYATINGTELLPGLYNATTNPEYFAGDSNLRVTIGTTDVENIATPVKVYLAGKQLYLEGNKINATIYDLNGRVLIQNSSAAQISLDGFVPGMYLVDYVIDGYKGARKIVIP